MRIVSFQFQFNTLHPLFLFIFSLALSLALASGSFNFKWNMTNSIRRNFQSNRFESMKSKRTITAEQKSKREWTSDSRTSDRDTNTQKPTTRRRKRKSWEHSRILNVGRMQSVCDYQKCDHFVCLFFSFSSRPRQPIHVIVRSIEFSRPAGEVEANRKREKCRMHQCGR